MSDDVSSDWFMTCRTVGVISHVRRQGENYKRPARKRGKRKRKFVRTYLRDQLVSAVAAYLGFRCLPDGGRTYSKKNTEWGLKVNNGSKSLDVYD